MESDCKIEIHCFAKERSDRSCPNLSCLAEFEDALNLFLVGHSVFSFLFLVLFC